MASLVNMGTGKSIKLCVYIMNDVKTHLSSDWIFNRSIILVITQKLWLFKYGALQKVLCKLMALYWMGASYHLWYMSNVPSCIIQPPEMHENSPYSAKFQILNPPPKKKTVMLTLHATSSYMKHAATWQNGTDQPRYSLVTSQQSHFNSVTWAYRA